VSRMNHPRVGIGVFVLKGNTLLLGQRRGSHGAGQYASPGGHLEPLESFEACARREVKEETGLELANVRFLRVMNVTSYAPKHYVDLAFAADWVSGEPQVLEPEKVESWQWYPLDALPQPLFATLPTALEALRTGRPCWDVG
jgi:8-oxo-dGTP diphosphatase